MIAITYNFGLAIVAGLGLGAWLNSSTSRLFEGASMFGIVQNRCDSGQNTSSR